VASQVVQAAPPVGSLGRARLLLPLNILKFRLAPGEGNVSVPYHMLDLTFHGDAKKRYEVHDEDGPEDWHVEKLKEGAEEGDGGGLGGGVPELELWQPPDERPELLVLPGG